MNRKKPFCDVSTSKIKHNCHTNIFLGLITVILVSSSKETYLSSGVIELLRHGKFRLQGRKLMHLFSVCFHMRHDERAFRVNQIK